MDIKKKLEQNAPELLIGFGLAGMLSSTILAVKATPKAVRMIDEENEIRRATGEQQMTKREVVKMCWKPYVPAALGYCASAACIIGANSVNSKRNAMLAGAYKLSEKAFIEYRDKVVEVIGEEKEKDIRDSVARDRIERQPAGEVIITGKGETLCYDMVSGRYFKSDIDKINKVINEVNYRLMQDHIVSLNDLYFELGMKSTEIGNDLGWNMDDGLIEIEFSSIISDDGQPALVMHFKNSPRAQFDILG